MKVSEVLYRIVKMLTYLTGKQSCPVGVLKNGFSIPRKIRKMDVLT